MPAIKALKAFEDQQAFVNYKAENGDIRIEHSKKLKYCDVCSENHEMKRQYANCNNEGCLAVSKCGKQFKILICLTSSRVQLHVVGEHTAKVVVNVEKHRGCTYEAKEKNEECIRNHLVKPKEIHVKLSAELSYGPLPTLLQVQTYVKNRRNAMGNNDNINELITYLKT
jgi:hypothetical protein